MVTVGDDIFDIVLSYVPPRTSLWFGQRQDTYGGSPCGRQHLKQTPSDERSVLVDQVQTSGLLVRQ